MLNKLALIFLIVSIIGFCISRFFPQKGKNAKEIPKTEWLKMSKTPIVGKTFTNQRILLDGYSYNNCRFTNVTLVYNGTAPFDLANNTFDGLLLVSSDGPEIMAIIITMKELGLLRPDLKIIKSDSK